MARPRPSLSIGCLMSESRATGSPGDSTQRIASMKNRAAAACASGEPAESSALMPNRPSSTATRRARSRSPVTRATLRPPSPSASRRATAIASPSSRSLAASTSAIFRSAPASSACVTAAWFDAQRSVVPAGRNASRTRWLRAAISAGGAAISTTSPRSTPIASTSAFRPNCGWPKTVGSFVSGVRAPQESSSR